MQWKLLLHYAVLLPELSPLHSIAIVGQFSVHICNQPVSWVQHIHFEDFVLVVHFDNMICPKNTPVKYLHTVIFLYFHNSFWLQNNL